MCGWIGKRRVFLSVLEVVRMDLVLVRRSLRQCVDSVRLFDVAYVVFRYLHLSEHQFGSSCRAPALECTWLASLSLHNKRGSTRSGLVLEDARGSQAAISTPVNRVICFVCVNQRRRRQLE